jgi:hypothetical protein
MIDAGILVLFDENANEVNISFLQSFTPLSMRSLLFIYFKLVVTGFKYHAEQWRASNIEAWKSIIAIKGLLYGSSKLNNEKKTYTVNCTAYEDTTFEVLIPSHSLQRDSLFSFFFLFHDIR